MSEPWTFPDLALSVGLRATFVLLVALVAAWGLRPRARLGSAVLHACLVGLLLLPLAAALTPRLCVPCLPGGTAGPPVVPLAAAPLEELTMPDETAKLEAVRPVVAEPAPIPSASPEPTEASP